MGTILKQNWDGILSGEQTRAGSGSSYACASRALILEDNFKVDSASKITKVQVKGVTYDGIEHKLYLFRLKDNKILWVSDVIAPEKNTDTGENFFIADCSIDITPEDGYFCVAYTPKSGSMYIAANSTSPDEAKYRMAFIDGPGWAAQVGEKANARNNFFPEYIGVKLELDGAGNNDDFNLTEKYQDESANEIKADVIKTVAKGTDFTTTVPAIPGYIFVGYKVDCGTLIAGSTITIPAVASDHVITFIYKKDNGSGGHEGNKHCCCCTNIFHIYTCCNDEGKIKDLVNEIKCKCQC